MYKQLLTTIFLASLVSACSSTNPGLTKQRAEEVQMCKQELPVSKKIKTESVTFGCLVNVAINRAIGSNNPAPLLCLAGGTSGFLFGESVAERKCNYITLEEQLDGEIAHAAKMNAGFNVVFAEQEIELKKYKLSAAGLAAKKADDEQGRLAMAAFEQTLGERLNKDKVLLATVKNEFRFKRETLLKSQAFEKTEKEEKLLEEIKALQKSIKLLQENNNKLARVKNELILGQ